MPSESAKPEKQTATGSLDASGRRRSGTLTLFLIAPGDPPDAPAAPAYARFRLCRGFLDDLNRDLPIRMRIQLETEIAKGRDRGRMESAGTGAGFRWEFAAG